MENTFECIICYETKSNDNKIMSICAHGPYCSTCYNRIANSTRLCSICKSSLDDGSSQEYCSRNRSSVDTLPFVSTGPSLIFSGSPFNSTMMSMMRELNGINNLTQNLNDELSFVLTQSNNILNSTVINNNLNQINLDNLAYSNNLPSNLNNIRNTNFNMNSRNEYDSDSSDPSISETNNNFLNQNQLTSSNDVVSLTNYVYSNIHIIQRRRKNSNGNYSCVNCRIENPCTECKKLFDVKNELMNLIEHIDTIGSDQN